jgi:hypothetical protein
MDYKTVVTFEAKAQCAAAVDEAARLFAQRVGADSVLRIEAAQ